MQGRQPNKSPSSSVSKKPATPSLPPKVTNNEGKTSSKSTPYKEYFSKPGSYLFKLEKKSFWKFYEEISYLIISKDSKGNSLLIVGQIDKDYITVNVEGQCQFFVSENEKQDLLPLITERKGPIKKLGSESVPEIFVICNSEGSLRLEDFNQTWWNLQFNRELFALNLLDVTGDGKDEIITCAWDGMTYIVDQEQNVVKFKFEESVCAFYAGLYSIDLGKQSPCFIYVTLENEIIVYYNIKLQSLKTRTLIGEMKNYIDDFYSLKENKLSIEWSLPEQASLFHSCLYYNNKSVAIHEYKVGLQNNLMKTKKRVTPRPHKDQEKQRKVIRKKQALIWYYLAINSASPEAYFELIEEQKIN